jgi:hypothetical protein
MCCLLLAQAGEYAGQLLAQAHLLQKPYCLPWDRLQLPVTVGSYTTQHNFLPVYRYPRLGQAAQRQCKQQIVVGTLRNVVGLCTAFYIMTCSVRAWCSAPKRAT